MFYFDYYSHMCLGLRVGQPFNGANNGTELLLNEILKSSYYGRESISVVYPRDFLPRDDYEKEFIEAEHFDNIYVDKLEDVNFVEGDSLLIPLVCGREMIEAEHLKKVFPFLKIYGRIHDKNHNFPLDLADRYYYSGLKRTGIPLVIDWIGKRMLFSIKFGSWMSNFDKVFTVSNFSLQKLKNRKVRFISYYYQGILSCYDEKNCNYNPKDIHDKYVLMINGSRPEKNGLRSILAFERYKRENPGDPIKLYITSTKKETQDNLLRTLFRYKEFRTEDIVFMDYLSHEELSDLYKKCRFLLFMSKGEGFGLPVLEAMMVGRPSLASWNSSIPEVATSSARYVDPFNIEAIKQGIEYFCDDEHLRCYEEAIRRRIPIVKAQIKEDTHMMIREFFED